MDEMDVNSSTPKFYCMSLGPRGEAPVICYTLIALEIDTCPNVLSIRHSPEAVGSKSLLLDVTRARLRGQITAKAIQMTIQLLQGDSAQGHHNSTQ